MDKIDKLLSGLSNDELRDLVKRAKKLVAKKPGRPTGWSRNDPYHTACRVAAYRVLRWRRDWLDQHPRKNILEKETIAAIERECQNNAAAFVGRDLEKAKETIHEHVKRSIRKLLPAQILKDIRES
jgi:hypothetical protein